jgi:hypothetical protein
MIRLGRCKRLSTTIQEWSTWDEGCKRPPWWRDGVAPLCRAPQLWLQPCFLFLSISRILQYAVENEIAGLQGCTPTAIGSGRDARRRCAMKCAMALLVHQACLMHVSGTICRASSLYGQWYQCCPDARLCVYFFLVLRVRGRRPGAGRGVAPSTALASRRASATYGYYAVRATGGLRADATMGVRGGAVYVIT